MSSLSNLAELLKKHVYDNIDSYWEEAETYGAITLSAEPNGLYTTLGSGIEKRGNKFLTSDAKGVYVWVYEGTILYVGKTDSKTQTIHKRQKQHRDSFEMKSKSESSGWKYREYMKENDLQTMKVVVRYINTNRFNVGGMAETLESASIETYQPKLNYEIKGRGSRNATYN
jgi:hypothetical protein